MGVPKFFRYISERYPCLSELVKEYQIPEFDNLYLDMNGIIHMCSHPDDYDPHFRISEEKIFSDIFHYIEVLFRMIKPQKLFFMAIDGVAPRAKMNQQRGRRFRTAKEAEQLEKKAREKGEVLPDQSRFDSNCITPGTVFMAKLHEQLKYFIVDKITKDPLWRECKIILSGHETPGEGEHKVMDYIRFLRSQPGYDPNTRHCLYGLDADLIMLGLCTHEPHFSLLREEVKFGKKGNSKRKNVPEQITFFLLHLSLMREYLEQEFIELKSKVSFGYNIESIIDDWVLMGFLVGNDFIPHLPNLHIANGAFPLLYSAYIKVLPTFDGYINENGKLNLERFEKFMAELCAIDMDHFNEQYADLKYFEGKTGRRPNEKERTSYKPRKLEEWQPEDGGAEDAAAFEALEGITKKAPMKSDLAALIKATEDMLLEPSEDNLVDLALELAEDIDEEVLPSDSDVSWDDEDDLITAEFQQHKKDYYMNKLDYAQVTSEVMRAQAECYVRAIQWNLNYYYNGVCSWSWYYPHHYAPFISDIKNFKDFQIEFDLATPFQPYEQLLAVLPAACKVLLPEVYHKLMEDPNSPIKDYFPTEFNTDLNGKKQDWEAVVLIPFIDEKRLLSAMAPCNQLLTPEEVKRNSHGPMLLYEYTTNDLGDYEAPEFFPVVKNNQALLTEIFNEDIRVPTEKLIKGAYPGALYDVYYPGFPTMKHLKYKSVLKKGNVKVFDQPSRGENMFLNIIEKKPSSPETVAQELLGKTVFVAWPHMIEALVISTSTKNYRYHSTTVPGEYNVEENKGNVGFNWEIEKDGIIEYYRDRLGVDVGETFMLVHVKVMIGRKYVFTSQGRVTLEKQWADCTSVYPWQTIVNNITSYNPAYKSYQNVEDVFTIGSTCFMLGLPHYGYQGTIQDSKESLKKGRVKVSLKVYDEPSFGDLYKLERTLKTSYMPVHVAASNLDMSKRLFSRITGSMFVIMGAQRDGLNDDAPRHNIGLNLKFNKKNEEVPGYTKKDYTWYYSQKAIDLVAEYRDLYPKLFDYFDNSGGSDIYYEYAIFPEDKGTGESVKKIVNWLKSQPFYSVERQACGSQTLDPDLVKEIEKCVDKHNESIPTKAVNMQVKPFLLYKPGLLMGNIAPDPTAMFQLYDRVVNVRESYTVPLGYTGTIIAVHRAPSGKPDDVMYDVLFDKPFNGGLALNCSSHRGYKMSRLSMINKTHGVREMEKKTGKPGQLLHKIGYNQSGSTQSPKQYQQQQKQYNINQNSAFASWRNEQSPQHAPSSNSYFPNNSPSHHQKNSTTSASNSRSDYKKKQDYKTDFMPAFRGQAPTSGGTANKASSNSNKQGDVKILERPTTKAQKGPAGQVSTQQVASSSVSAASLEGVKLSVQDIFAHASAQMQKYNMPAAHLPQSPGGGAPPRPMGPTQFSIQLLSQFQMRGLGCPLYQYFFEPTTKMFQAQLKMPITNEPLFGKPAPSKEDASENVAEIALQKLVTQTMPMAMSPMSMPMQFPTPPMQWCRSQDNGNSGHHQSRPPAPQQQQHFQQQMQFQQLQHVQQQQQQHIRPINNQQHMNQNVNPNVKAGQVPQAPGAVPFVPLQAVRQQRNRHNSGHGNTQTSPHKKGANHAHNREKEVKKQQQERKSDDAKDDENKTGKPKRERKMRLAANFSMQP